jgi:CelD/BcsL family acetyltransferase involved in cellulose biosynthesis
VETEVVKEWDGGKAFDDLVRLHTARWARDGQPGRFGSLRFAQFLRSVTETLMPQGSARIYFARHGAERICGLLVFDMQRQNYQYLVGRDPSHELMRYSVGEVIAMRAAMDAFDEGSLVCDMMGGDYHHKRYTGMTKRWYSRVTAIAAGLRGAKGRVYWGALAARDALDRMKQIRTHAESDSDQESTGE